MTAPEGGEGPSHFVVTSQVTAQVAPWGARWARLPARRQSTKTRHPNRAPRPLGRSHPRAAGAAPVPMAAVGTAGAPGTARARPPGRVGAGERPAAAGADCRLSPTQLDQLAAALEEGPAAHGYTEDQRWTPARVADLIGRLFRIRYTLRGVSLLLHRMGFSPQMPVHRPVERDEEAVTTICFEDEGSRATAVGRVARARSSNLHHCPVHRKAPRPIAPRSCTVERAERLRSGSVVVRRTRWRAQGQEPPFSDIRATVRRWCSSGARGLPTSVLAARRQASTVHRVPAIP